MAGLNHLSFILAVLNMLWLHVNVALSYKPVVFMHGLGANESEFVGMIQAINTSHPGTETFAITQYDGILSLKTDMDTQTKHVGQTMIDLMKRYPQGIHLVCYSQGGLVCRGVLEKFKHNVDTFISLSAPLAGIYGDMICKNWTRKGLKKYAYKLFYTSYFQRHISIANYWKDPHHLDLYRKKSIFLAPLNLESNTSSSSEYAANFARLKKLVMIGGPDDEVIAPWQSSHFGYYDENEEVVEMRNQKWYKDDSFGLKTLDKRKALVTHVVPGVTHHYWYKNMTIINQYVLPYLT